jgi:hypothetical protein
VRRQRLERREPLRETRQRERRRSLSLLAMDALRVPVKALFVWERERVGGVEDLVDGGRVLEELRRAAGAFRGRDGRDGGGDGGVVRDR